MPKIRLGKPDGDIQRFMVEYVQDIAVYYSPGLMVKPGSIRIEINLKRLLFWQWLELDGAKGKVTY